MQPRTTRQHLIYALMHPHEPVRLPTIYSNPYNLKRTLTDWGGRWNLDLDRESGLANVTFTPRPDEDFTFPGLVHFRDSTSPRSLADLKSDAIASPGRPFPLPKRKGASYVPERWDDHTSHVFATHPTIPEHFVYVGDYTRKCEVCAWVPDPALGGRHTQLVEHFHNDHGDAS